MKKILIIALALLWSISFYGSKKTYFLESFQNYQNIQQIYDESEFTFDRTTNWYLFPTKVTGEKAPEMGFECIQDEAIGAEASSRVKFKGTARMISPWYDTKNTMDLFVGVKHWFSASKADTDKGYGIAVRKSPEAEWENVFEMTNVKSNEKVPVKNAVTKLPSSLQGADSLQVCFFVTSADSNNISYRIFFSGFQLFSVSGKSVDFKLGISDLMSVADKNIVVKGVFSNTGLPMDSCVIKCQIDEDTVLSLSYKKLGLNPSQEKAFSFPAYKWNNTPGVHTLKLWCSKIDEQLTDTTQEGMVYDFLITIYDSEVGVSGRYLLENFTSSTCPPCVSNNKNVVTPIYDQYKGQFTLVKYQMNFPGSGDPYYIAACGTRLEYYGVTGVPDMYGDGAKLSTGSSTINTTIGNAIKGAPNKKVPFEIKNIVATLSSEDSVHITYAIYPYTSATMTVQTLVLENETSGNASSNGETSFKNVTMAMLPNGEGKELTFVAGEEVSFTYSYDMRQTKMEEGSDLFVAVFIQDPKTKKVYQVADKAIKGAGDANIARALSFKIFPYSANLNTPILGEILNIGDTLTSVEIQFQAGEKEPKAYTFQMNLGWRGNGMFQIKDFVGVEGSQNLKFWISKVNDVAVQDIKDTISMDLEIILTNIPFRPIIEGYTSSACILCKELNEKVINPVYLEHKNNISMIKYPLGEDPYAQISFSNRAKSYGANITDVFVDGLKINWTETSADAKKTQLNTILTEALSKKSLYEFSEFKVTIGMNGTSNFIYFYSVTPKVTTKVLVTNVLVEGETKNNIGPNGETIFLNTAKALIPVSGSLVSGVEGKPSTVRGQTNYTNLKIENYANLYLVSLVQDITTMEVLQSSVYPVTNEVSIEKELASVSLSLYPNPASDRAELVLNEKSNVIIFDVMGRKMYEKKSVEGLLTIDLSTFAKGAYVVKVSNTSHVATAKLNVVK